MKKFYDDVRKKVQHDQLNHVGYVTHVGYVLANT